MLKRHTNHTKSLMEPEADSISSKNYTVQDLINDIRNILHDLPNRVHICRICKIRFSEKEDVITHEKIHAIRLYKCIICRITFRTMLAWNEHYYSKHVKVHKHTCTICSRNFIRYANYYKHLKKHGK